jgi:predicted phosphodiesterase
MIVEVTAVDWNAGSSRRAMVALVDHAGNDLQLVDYEGAELTVEWEPNHRYRISGCNVNKGGADYPVALEPSKRTLVESLGPVTDHTSLLVVGDTHVGRTTHPKTESKIDPIDAFTNAVEYGIECGVDAVVHVGDIFHESASEGQATAVDRRVFAPLENASILFYFVRGNHTAEPGDRVLASRSLVSNLDTGGERIGSDVRIFGIDHAEEGELPWKTLSFPSRVSEPISILVMHQTLRQLSGPTDKSVDLDRIQRRFGGQFDLVLSGHHHDAMMETRNGTTVMYTGASERMSTNRDPIDRVVWLVTSAGSSVAIERYDIL